MFIVESDLITCISLTLITIDINNLTLTIDINNLGHTRQHPTPRVRVQRVNPKAKANTCPIPIRVSLKEKASQKARESRKVKEKANLHTKAPAHLG